ncbi:MAG: hypothetical protein ABFS39_10140 [Pseudomonadota bacterium]
MTYLRCSHLWLLLATLLPNLALAVPAVRDTYEYHHTDTGLSIIRGQVSLPSKGSWLLKSVGTEGVTEAFLLVPEMITERGKGMRELENKEKNQRNQDRYLLQRLHQAATQYAREHEGQSPAGFKELNSGEYLKPENQAKIHLLPPLKIVEKNERDRWVNVQEVVPLAFELTPLIDDAQHWVLMSNGSVVLQEIDPVMVNAAGVTITARGRSVAQRMAAIPKSIDYTIVARKAASAGGFAELFLDNVESGQSLKIEWPLIANNSADSEIFKQWGTQRIKHWLALGSPNPGGLMSRWIRAAAAQYGLSADNILQAERRRDRDRGRVQPGLFNMLGGRSAMRETFQLQSLRPAAGKKATPSVPIAGIEGVKVRSHPFDEMLGKKKGGSLELANLVPADRMFAWFSAPESLLQLLDTGSKFIFNGIVAAGGDSTGFDLNNKYMSQLSLTDETVRRFLKSDAVDDIGVILPDVFLRDGTDMTVVMRLRNSIPGWLAGVTVSSDIVARETSTGGLSYWVKRDGILMISTHRAELQRVLQLQKAGGANSLGHSAEFRYMLTQLSVQNKTQSYFYFSDPFIRRLTGPAVKIGQLRRLQARKEMENLVAARLLYLYDGGKGEPAIDELVARKYLPAFTTATDITMAADASVSSAGFGTASNMKTLLQRPVTNVTKLEAKAYKAYLDRYNRFWNRFFDPIAIRINRNSATEMEAETFILPLIENSIYDAFKELVISGDAGIPLNKPLLDPEPVASLSLNLSEEMREKAKGSLHKFLGEILGIPSGFMDYLDSDLHFAIGDSDPVLVMGSGELTGSLGMMVGGRRSFDRLMWPILGSMLTRPATLMIGLKDPEAVRDVLRNVSVVPDSGRGLFGGGRGSLYRVSGKDAWRYDISFEGLLSIRIGLEVKGRYLVISNQPLSFDPQIVKTDTGAANSASMFLSPVAAVRQLPALYASGHKKLRISAISSMSDLYPVLMAEGKNVPTAVNRVEQLLGYTPKHPGHGRWLWRDGELVSSTYGTIRDPQQPAYSPGDSTFGVLAGIDRVHLSMQFEHDGLRAVCRWSLAK